MQRTFMRRGETKIRKVRLDTLPVKSSRFYISAHYKPVKTSGDLLLWDRGIHTHLGTACPTGIFMASQCCQVLRLMSWLLVNMSPSEPALVPQLQWWRHQQATGGWPGKGSSNSLSKQLQQEGTWELLLLLSCCLCPRTGHCSLECLFPHQKMTQPQAAGPPHKHFFIDISKSYRDRLCTKNLQKSIS